MTKIRADVNPPQGPQGTVDLSTVHAKLHEIHEELKKNTELTETTLIEVKGPEGPQNV